MDLMALISSLFMCSPQNCLAGVYWREKDEVSSSGNRDRWACDISWQDENIFEKDAFQVNPATGLIMIGIFDTAGNPYGLCDPFMDQNSSAFAWQTFDC